VEPRSAVFAPTRAKAYHLEHTSFGNPRGASLMSSGNRACRLLALQNAGDASTIPSEPAASRPTRRAVGSWSWPKPAASRSVEAVSGRVTPSRPGGGPCRHAQPAQCRRRRPAGAHGLSTRYKASHSPVGALYQVIPRGQITTCAPGRRAASPVPPRRRRRITVRWIIGDTEAGTAPAKKATFW